MVPASSSPARTDLPLFVDGLGERVMGADPSTGELLQILEVRTGLTAVPSFEFALRERTARLMNFRHAYYARVRRVDRRGGDLAIVSDHVEGTRLSELLSVAHTHGLQLNTNAALGLLRQLVPAIALLHENARDVAHGLIAPERVVVTPHGRLVVVEHVAGSAIEQLQLGRERLWQELRVTVPATAGVARFDHRADVNGIGITALSLILGRPIAADEFPHGIGPLLMEAREHSPLGDERPLSPAFRNWLGRALQLDVRRAFATAPEALAALDDTLAAEPSYVPAPVALETFLAQYATVARTGTASVPQPAAVTAPSALVISAPVASTTTTAAEAPAPSVSAGPHPAAPPPLPPQIAEAPSVADLIPVDDLRVLAHAGGGSTARPDPDFSDMDLAVPASAEPNREDATAAAEPAVARTGRRRLAWAAAAALVVLIGGGAYVAQFVAEGANTPALGTLVVQSSPAGVQVFVDGVSRGTTPARVSLAPGSHILELRGRGIPRVIPLQISAGAQVSQYLEFADTPSTGVLVVHSQPAGATVTVDGVPRGTAPLTLDGLAAGDHDVVLQDASGSSRHVVKVLAGTTASLVAPVVSTTAAEGPVSGWISVQAPFVVEIFEDGKLIGTTDTERLMLASGRHTLEFVNQALGYRESRPVQVVPGKVAAVALDLPSGSVNLNAAPWAEVWIDGRRVGETPIGNLAVPIGPHEIVFRHPEFGERKHAVSVTTAAPVRLSVQMK